MRQLGLGIYPCGSDGRFNAEVDCEAGARVYIHVDGEQFGSGFAQGWYDGAGRVVTVFPSQATSSTEATWNAGTMKVRKSTKVSGQVRLNDGSLPDAPVETYAYGRNPSTGKYEMIASLIAWDGVWQGYLRPGSYYFRYFGPAYSSGSRELSAFYAGGHVVSSRGLATRVTVGTSSKSGITYSLKHRFPTPWNTKSSLVTITPNGDGHADSARISYNLDRDASVTVKVLNAAGETVRHLKKNANQAAGAHSLSFTGKRSDGTRLPNGKYRIDVKSSNTRGYGSKSVTVSVSD